TGYSNNGTNDDYYTAKYAAADGTLLWEKRYNGPANINDQAVAVVVDGSGNVVVTGWFVDTNLNADFYTAKYATENGSLLWERRYNGPANKHDFATSMAVDGIGNVIVTGTSDNGSNVDYYTAKYAAVDGALLWERRRTGPVNKDFGAASVAVDAIGNVIVTGNSNNGTNDDYYTVKYAAADGSLLWEKRYNGPADGYDSAKAVAVDAVGNAVVTGYSYNGSDADCYTVKYAAANGATLWEKRYNGPTSADDAIPTQRSLSLGSNGMVAIAGYSIANFNRGYSDARDYVTIVYRENLPSVSITRVPAGLLFRFPGIAGRSYQVLRAPAITGPWSTNATFIAATNGLIEYIDATPLPGSAFYRTSTP
ncbi:MAG TPA: hypothetical protein VNT99_06330, partial [Methylomirabilota bacterium]|nr:hypothetical protein [Methylomirabilota bacterium]